MDERYEIRGELGKGGLGAVFRGYDRNLKREVAIKRILPGDDEDDREEALKQLTEEAGNLCALQHPHIVTVYDVGSDDEGPFVVMELLTGQTLEELIERGPLTWEDFRELALQTQEALIAAQERHLVHRDIKPGNVMLTWLPSGKFQTKLVDFGLAKFSPKPTQQDIGKDDSVFGSIFFMAPEQFERKPLDARTDMYATGCVYYHALTGHYPFDGTSGQEVMQAHLDHIVKPLHEVREDIPRWASDWVMWHMNRNPDDRPADARESLQLLIMSDQTPTQAPVPEQPAQNAPKRPRLLIPGTQATEVPATPTAQAVPAPPTQPVTAQPVQPVQPVAAQPVQAVPPVQAAPPATPPAAAPAPPLQAQPVQAAPAEALQAQPVPAQAAAPPPLPAAPAEPPPAAEAPRPEPKPTSPQPLQPPAGSKPSVHSAARKATSQVAAQATEIATVALTPAQAQPGAALLAGTPEAANAPLATAAPPETFIGEAHQTKKKKKLSPAATAAIAAVLGLLAVLLGYLLLVRMGDNKKNEIYNALVAQAKQEGVTEIPVNKDQLQILLDAATSISANSERETIYHCLQFAKSSDGTNLDTEIARHATEELISDGIRMKFFKVLELRGNPDALPMLLGFISKSSKVNEVSAALEACKGMASDENFDQFLSVLSSSQVASIRRAAEGTISEIIERSGDRDQLAKSIVSSYRGPVDDTTKHSLLRLLGYTGSDAARDIISEAHKSTNPLEKQSAILALGNWPDDSMFEVLIEFLEGEDDEQFRNRTFDTAYKFLQSKKRKRSSDEAEDLWKMLAGNAKTNREQMQIINGVARADGEWVISVIEYFIDEAEADRVIDEAEKALDHIKERQKIKGGKKDDE